MTDERVTRLQARLASATRKHDELSQELRAIVARRKAIVDYARSEAREDLTVPEDVEFRHLVGQGKDLTNRVAEVREEITQINERLGELKAENMRSARITAGAADLGRAQAGGAYTQDRSTVYREGNGRSYFRDLIRAGSDPDAQDRLRTHASEARDLNRTDGNGGYFVPPLWMTDRWVELARPGRVTANLCNQMTLPGGTDSVNIPKVATGTSVAAQDGDNTSVSETDLTDAVVTLPVRTIAGQQDIAQQLLDQSPVEFDRVIFEDLAGSYAEQVNQQVISGTGSNGQLKGIRTASGTISLTYTDTSPSAQELFSKIAEGISRITSERYRSPTAVVMHPRRWAWLLAQVDGSGRPLVVPTSSGSMNASGTAGALNVGLAGEVVGLPCYVDPAIPTNLGSGTNEDTVLIMKTDDIWLYESGIRTRVLPDVGSGTLTVRLQLWGYAAFSAERQPKSIVKIGGTGCIAPSF